jgi:hypothetical protein
VKPDLAQFSVQVGCRFWRGLRWSTHGHSRSPWKRSETWKLRSHFSEPKIAVALFRRIAFNDPPAASPPLSSACALAGRISRRPFWPQPALAVASMRSLRSMHSRSATHPSRAYPRAGAPEWRIGVGHHRAASWHLGPPPAGREATMSAAVH